MKKLRFVLLTGFAAATSAQAEEALGVNGRISGVKTSTEATYVKRCVDRVGPGAVIACQGVKSSFEVNDIADCVAKVGANAAIACRGLGPNSANVGYIVNCVRGVGVEHAAICMGVDSYVAGQAVVDCFRSVGAASSEACGEMPPASAR